jgi:hypothetical protein
MFLNVGFLEKSSSGNKRAWGDFDIKSMPAANFCKHRDQECKTFAVHKNQLSESP